MKDLVFPKSDPVPKLLLNFGFGLNEGTTPSLEEASSGYNFDLAIDQHSLIPRKPFDLKGTAPNALTITGLMQLITRANAETTLACAGTAVYKWDGSSTFTSVATVTSPAYLRETYWSLGDYIVITDVKLNNAVAKWDGTTYSTLTTGLGSTLYAKYAIAHLNRMWFFNITLGSTTYPHMILVSKFEDPTTLDNTIRGGPSTVGGGTFTTGLEAFYILTPDLKPINGVALFQNSLIISTVNGRMWQLIGSSSADFQFIDFYDTQPSIGDEAIENVGNDVVFVAQGGEIFNLNVTEKLGTLNADSVSRLIPVTTANLSTINKIVYDVLNQKVLFFIPSKVLVLFKDIEATEKNKSPWSAYITDDSSGFNTNAAKYMRQPGTQNYSVFFGDSTGRIFDLNGTGSKDAGSSAINVNRRSRHIGTEVLDPWPWMEENITGFIRYRRLTPISVSVALDWDDEYSTNTSTVALKGPAASDSAPYFNLSSYFGDSVYFNQGFSFANKVSSMNLDPGGKGPGFYLTVSTSTNVPFQVDAVEFD